MAVGNEEAVNMKDGIALIIVSAYVLFAGEIGCFAPQYQAVPPTPSGNMELRVTLSPKTGVTIGSRSICLYHGLFN